MGFLITFFYINLYKHILFMSMWRLLAKVKKEKSLFELLDCVYWSMSAVFTR